MYSVALLMALATSGESANGAAAQDNKLKPGALLSAEEHRWLKNMLAAEKDPAERAKIEDEFKKDSRVGRKATYDVFKRMKGGKGEISSEPKMKEAKSEIGGERATIVVTLPASARLTIDGNATRSTSSTRTFV